MPQHSSVLEWAGGRFGLYSLAALAGSAVDSSFTRRSDTWPDTGLASGALVAVYALGVPILIAMCAELPVKLVACVTAASSSA